MLVASNTYHSPEWEPNDRSWLQAYLIVQKDRCPGCGQSRIDMEDRAFNRSLMAETHKCHGCEVVEQAKTDLASSEGATDGVYVYAASNEKILENQRRIIEEAQLEDEHAALK